MNVKKDTAIRTLYTNVVFIIGEEAFDENKNPVIYDESAVIAEMNRMAYIGQRQAEYPSFADQFDALFHGGYDAWKSQIQAVKDKYPKE